MSYYFSTFMLKIFFYKSVDPTRLELVTSSLQMRRSTIKLRALERAGRSNSPPHHNEHCASRKLK